jgi:SAM-dependent methyltransferase
MTTPSKATANGSTPSIMRRREKRKHQANSIISLRDPFDILALAIRYDESLQDPSILRAPLQSARLFDPDLFAHSLEILEQRTKAPTKLSLKDRRAARKGHNDPVALTPVILAGLLNALEELSSTTEKAVIAEADVSSKLVQYCQAMRRSTLKRLERNRYRNRVQRIVLPLGSAGILFCVYLLSVTAMRQLLIEMHFIDSCENMGDYAVACQLAEAALWDKYRDYVLSLGETPCGMEHSQQLPCNHALLHNRYMESPFALHAFLSQNIIGMEEIESGRKPRPSTRDRKSGMEKHSLSLNWLGRSTVNIFVRDTIHRYMVGKKEWTILDAGSGVGGTLYTLLDSVQNTKLTYHGITVSAAESYLARRLLLHHNLDLLNIRFHQQTFDEPLPSKSYHAVLAIESLTYARNLTATLRNLVQTLQPGGVLVVADHVAYHTPDEEQERAVPSYRPSLVSQDVWTQALQNAGCRLDVHRDLSMEYDVGSHAPVVTSWDLFALSPYWSWRWFWRGHDAAAERLQKLQLDRLAVKQQTIWTYKGYEDAALGYHVFVCTKLN